MDTSKPSGSQSSGAATSVQNRPKTLREWENKWASMEAKSQVGKSKLASKLSSQLNIIRAANAAHKQQVADNHAFIEKSHAAATTLFEETQEIVPIIENYNQQMEQQDSFQQVLLTTLGQIGSQPEYEDDLAAAMNQISAGVGIEMLSEYVNFVLQHVILSLITHFVSS